MANLKNKETKAMHAPRHRVGETAPIEDGELSIGDPDIWGNGINNTLVQPSIGVSGFTLNAASRLVESMTIKMKDNYPANEFEEDVEYLEHSLAKGVKPISLGSKDGLSLFVLNKGKYSTVPNFYLTKGKEIVGLLIVEKSVAADYEVSKVHVKESFRGQHLGVVLYLAAIHVYKSICSSDNIGIAAVKTWQKVSQYHKVYLYSVEHKLFVRYDWGRDGIPIVKIAGARRPITDIPADFLFVVKA